MRPFVVAVASALAAVPGAARSAEVEVDAIRWASGAEVGNGVAFKDTGNPLGANAFVGYAGYHVKDEHARAWVTELYRTSLRARGVRYLWAVRGPDDPLYRHLEIGNSLLAKSLVRTVSGETKFVVVAGHSSGSYAAHELLGQLAGGADPEKATAAKVIYFDLDGGDNGLTVAAVRRLRHAYFVGSFDAAKGTYSPHAEKMRDLAKTYGAKYLQNDASGSGCNSGANWCVHATLVTARPHDPANVDPTRDYSDFAGRAVAHSFIESAAQEAGL